MEIEVRVVATTEVEVDFTVTPIAGRLPGPTGAPRHRFVFSDDLVLERIDAKKPGDGLPQSPQDRLAGAHSGFGTTVRVAGANDALFPEGSMLFQYEGTYLFDPVLGELPTGLPRGQIVARGVSIFDGSFHPLKPLTFAIVGGTEGYEGASGQVIHSGPDGGLRTLRLRLSSSGADGDRPAAPG
jgi:hypothetical protein